MLWSVVALLLLVPLACSGGGKSTPTAAPFDFLSAKPLSPEMVSMGQQMFLEKGCGGCHTVDGLRGASGRMGPRLNGVATLGRDRLPGLNVEQYLRQSIENPDSFVVPGYLARMPDNMVAFNSKEYEAIITYLLSLK